MDNLRKEEETRTGEESSPAIRPRARPSINRNRIKRFQVDVPSLCKYLFLFWYVVLTAHFFYFHEKTTPPKDEKVKVRSGYPAEVYGSR